MNKLSCLIISLLTYSVCESQTLGWEWAYSGNGNDFEKGSSICSDNSGNVYVTGFFSGPTITFGSITLVNSGNWNAFIVKYDSTGTVLWAKSPTGYHSEGKGISTDDNGNVFVTGSYWNDSISFDAITLSNSGSHDIFLAKFDAEGNVIWARCAGGQRVEQANSVCTDGDGNVAITGFFESDSLVFDSQVVYHNIDTIHGDIFIAKYNSEGNSLWAKSARGAGLDIGTAITSDQAGNIYATGTFASSSVAFESDTLIMTGGNDVFVIKYDPTGNEQWVISAGGSSYAVCYSIITDLPGNVFITGYFYVPFMSFGNLLLTNSTGFDVFVVKIDAAGNFVWAKSSVGGQQAEGHGVCTDMQGNVYVTGFYAFSTVSFDSITLSLASDSELFLVKYDTDGNVIWGFAEGGNSSDFSEAVCKDLNGDIIITGSFYSDSISFGTSTLHPIGKYDMFIAKTGSIFSGLSNQNFDNSIHLFPNPFSDKINITAKGSEPVEINLFDVTSRKMLHQSFTKSTLISTEQLARGIYLYEVRNKDRVIKKGKVVRE
jgi:hypothetical protein